MRVTLVGEQKARAENRGERPRIERVPDAVGVDDASGEKDRDRHRRADSLEQLERRGPTANMTAGLHPLSDHGVRARLRRRFGLVNRPALMAMVPRPPASDTAAASS